MKTSYWIGVRLSGPTNSTIFTNCCGVAICDYEPDCPKCKQEVAGGRGQTEQERRRLRWEVAHGRWKR